MKKLFDRRTTLATLAILVLYSLGVEKGVEVAAHIVTVVGFVVAGNVTQAIREPKAQNAEPKI